MEALIFELIKELLPFLYDKATQLVELNADDELKKLEAELVKAQSLLAIMRITETWKRSTEEVFRICYDVEDLVDDFQINTNNSSKIKKFKTSLKKKRGSTKKKIEDIQTRLERVINDLKLENKMQQQKEQRQCAHEENKPPDKHAHICLGREEEKEKVIRLLLDKTTKAVSIVGIGGLGKTTLAWDVQNDSRIKEKFPHYIWVPVSAKFVRTEVDRHILKRSPDYECSYLTEDTISSLFEKLYGEDRLLIVLDGLSDITPDEWISFSSSFLCTSGSKILVTTRNPEVASKTRATPYQLPLMSDEGCQAILTAKANLSGRNHNSLKDHVKAIAQNCKGLPLAAASISLSLNDEVIKEYENLIADLSKEDKYITRSKEKIFNALKLNIADISSNLMKGLAYCSLFPYNHDFKRDTVVQLWMAEGFIPPQGTRSLGEIGNQYFKPLYGSFFQRSQIEDHEISIYKMHEFIHRFAESVASKLFFRLEDIMGDLGYKKARQARHLSLCTGSTLDWEKIAKCDSLRTLLLPNKHSKVIHKIPYSVFAKLGRLRVLDLSHANLHELPDNLGRLRLLRYLDVSNTCILLLPGSICNIPGLQVLKLINCNELLELPRNLNTLTSLVHLEVDMQRLRCKPKCVGNLSNLQTLSVFSVGKEEGYRITELKNLNNLHGTLSLVDLENVNNADEAIEAELSEKLGISKLKLQWGNGFQNGSIAMEVFTSIQPHNHLKVLEVTNYVGSSFPAWVTSQYSRLVSISVHDCSPDDILSSFGKLPYLENLYIEGMNCVVNMTCPPCGDGSTGAFPSLKSLKLMNMNCLKMWHSLPYNCMLKLSDLRIIDCPVLSSVPSLNHMKLLQTLEISRCQVLEELPQLPATMIELIIFDCDLVQERCQRGDFDWSSITFISKMFIGNNAAYP